MTDLKIQNTNILLTISEMLSVNFDAVSPATELSDPSIVKKISQ